MCIVSGQSAKGVIKSIRDSTCLGKHTNGNTLPVKAILLMYTHFQGDFVYVLYLKNKDTVYNKGAHTVAVLVVLHADVSYQRQEKEGEQGR